MQTTFNVSGFPTVYRAGERIAFSTRYDLALLLYMAMNPVTHSREHLARLLWAQSPNALGDLRSSLTRLRKNFSPWLHTDTTTVTFAVDSCFAIVRDDLAPFASGLCIGIAYDAWLDTERHEMNIVMPRRWKPQGRTAVSHIAGWCRDHARAVAWRGQRLPEVDTSVPQSHLDNLRAEMERVTDERKRAIVAFINLKAITETEFAEQMKRLDSRLVTLASDIGKAERWVQEEQAKNESMDRLRDIRLNGIGIFAEREHSPKKVNQWLRKRLVVHARRKEPKSKNRIRVTFL